MKNNLISDIYSRVNAEFVSFDIFFFLFIAIRYAWASFYVPIERVAYTLIIIVRLKDVDYIIVKGAYKAIMFISIIPLNKPTQRNFTIVTPYPTNSFNHLSFSYWRTDIMLNAVTHTFL